MPLLLWLLPDLMHTQHISERYGQTQSAMYVVPLGGTMQGFSEAKRFVDDLKAGGACHTVISVLALPSIVSHDEESEVRDLVEKVPASDGEARALLARVLAHPNGKGELVSDDGQSMLVICPLTKAVGLSAERVDPMAVASRFWGDLALGGLLAAGFAVAILIAMRRSRAHPLLGLLGLPALAVLAPAWWSNPAATTLGRLLGPAASHTLAKLSQVTHADRTLLLSVPVDARSATGIGQLDATCRKLEPFGDVHCPTSVLKTMAHALTGREELPATDEQLGALWFFGGDRPELRLLFTPDKTSALVRVTTARFDEPNLRAIAQEANASLGGMPLIDTADFTLPLLVFALVCALGAWWLRPRGATGVALALSALAMPPAIVAWPMGVLGTVICATAALAPAKKTRQARRP